MPSPTQAAQRQVQHRLTPKEVDSLLADYQAGHPVEDLARDYRINRFTVLQHVRRAGLRKRYPALLPGEIEVAGKLYQSGLSLAAVGTQLGVDPSTVRKALLSAGIAMRDTHGRKR